MAGSKQRALEFVSIVRSPESGLRGQGMRFALSGGAVAGLYLVVTTTLAELGVALVALAIGFVTGMVVHFTLHRVFVWMHAVASRCAFTVSWAGISL